MGWVWEATHEFTGKQVAIKFLKGGKEQDRRRFVREVRAASAVHHANVIDVHDFIELPDGTLAMAMELLRGETLGAVLQREKKIPLAALAQIVLPVIDALDAAHRAGIIHRDLKPDNVFLEKDGDDSDAPPRIKVLDFGVAKLTASEGLAARTQALTGTGTMVGTPYYMSPEQVVSEKDLDGRADIWSLGVLLYECLSGVRPTEADNVGRVLKRILTADFEPISTYCADLPADVSALVMKMLAGDRDERTRSLGDVRAVLERYAGETFPRFAPPPSAPAVDPHAATVDAELEKTGDRGDTHRAVSVAHPAPSRARARIAIAAFAALIVAVSGYALRGVFVHDTRTDATPVSPPPLAAEPSQKAEASPTSATTPSASVAIRRSAPSASAEPARTNRAPALIRSAASAVVSALPVASVTPVPPATASVTPAAARSGPEIAKGPKD